MTDTAAFTVKPKAWMHLAHANSDTDAIEALRVVMDAWIAQQSYIIRIEDRTGRPMQPLAYALHHAIEVDDLHAARAAIVRADRNPVWAKCARRHMLVAAANGSAWNYGDPAAVPEWDTK